MEDAKNYNCPMACQVEGEGRLFTGRPWQCRRSPGRRTPCRGSHLGPAPVHTPRRWRPTQRPCCGRWPAGRKPGWSLAGGASWWGDKGMAEWVGEGQREDRKWEEKNRTSGLPDDLNQFTHVDMVWHQELSLVQDGKLFFSFIPLDDHLQETHT